MEDASVWDEATFQLPEVKAISLLDLDPHQPERAELRAAGVPNHRIEALYPAAFGGLLSNLLNQMAQIASSELIHICYAEQQLDSILYARESRKLGPGVGESTVVNRRHMQAYLHAAEHEAAYDELKTYLLGRFGNPSFQKGTSEVVIAATKVLWCTHWLQAHRHELKPEYASVADALDARMCTILALNPA